MDRHGAGAGNGDHAARRADHWLDISYQIDLLELLSELNREQGYTLAAVLHDLNRGLPLCNTPDCPAGWQDRGAGRAERDCHPGAD